MIHNAIIQKTFLGFIDGKFSCTIQIKIEKDMVTLGYGVFSEKSSLEIVRFLIRLLNTLEVKAYECLEGTHCRVEIVNNTVKSIGHWFSEDRWFYLQNVKTG